MPASAKYLQQIELSILDAAFQAWQSLGNASPVDDSGASSEVSACASLACQFDLTSAVKILAEFDESSPLTREISGYCDLLAGLSQTSPSIPPAAVEKLLPCCSTGNARPQKILSAVGCMIGGSPGEVPGLDRPSSFLSAAEFFVDADDPKMGSLLLSRGKWDFSRAYRTAALALMKTPHRRAERVAWEMGAGMGDEVSASHCAAYGYLEGKGSASRFRSLHRAAERGFPLPLLTAAAALEMGVGVDPDPTLASAYMSVAKRISPPQSMLVQIRQKMASGHALLCERKDAPGNASAIMFNWASKHPNDPIHRRAAVEWRRARLLAHHAPGLSSPSVRRT